MAITSTLFYFYNRSKIATATLHVVLLLLLLLSLQVVPRTQSFHVVSLSSSSTSSLHYYHNRNVLILPSPPSRSFLKNQLPLFSASSNDEETDDITPPTVVKCPNCEKCDGSGRIEGGIGTILTFWPIKCYRPCPTFIENGGFYQRAGQGLDEIAFGRDTKYDQIE
mmetsp:Transcript_65522/g.73118  ORF Transcript_65522/g.73118 Transcript_65522/m.73118 type:complete len:166 (+) Transcript_65522:37-534(+)